MPLVPAKGILRYSDFDFSVYTETIGVRITPELDGAKRTVVASRFLLTFRTRFTGTNKYQVDNLAKRARVSLSKPARAFVCTGRGIGDIYVNTGGVVDVANGPLPKELSFEAAVGGDMASTLTWSIEFVIPECPDARFKDRPMEYVYSMTYQTDAAGYTTRTMRGYLKIPQNRVAAGVRFAHSSALDWRESVVPALLTGFQRTYGPFGLSEDRAKLTFEVVDTEMGTNIPPPYCVSADASMSYQTSGHGWYQWTVNLQANYELVKGASPNIAINAFANLLKDRVGYISRLKFNDGKGGKDKPVAVPLGFSMSEPEIYGKNKFSFGCSLHVVTSLDSILRGNAGGLWQPVAGSDWRRWAVSLQDTALHPGGTAKLTFDVGEDRIIDLCDPTPYARILEGQAPVEVVRELVRGAQLPPPTLKNSWMMYDVRLEREQESGAVMVRTMPPKPIADDKYDIGGKSTLVSTGVGFPKDQPTTGNGFTVTPPRTGGILVADWNDDGGATKGRRRVRPAVYLILTGRAMRVGFPIPEPKLERVNGVDVIPANRTDRGEGFKTWLVYQTALTGVYAAEWRLRYLLTDDLDPKIPLPTPPNPMFDGNN